MIFPRAGQLLSTLRDHWVPLKQLTAGHPAELRVDSLDVYYGPVQALRGVSLEMGPREAVAILGANGAGKTTLLSTIAGVHRPRHGKICFAGASLVGRPAFTIAQAGVVMVPEGRQIFTGLTVNENLILGASSRSDRPSVQQDLQWIFDVFPILCEKRQQRAGELSGGQQQMLAIGRGLMSNPRLLCLDEPSLGLSPRLVEELTELIQRIRRERQTGVIIVEQNAAMALSIAERAYVMHRGRIVWQGTSQEVLASDLRAAYLGSVPQD